MHELIRSDLQAYAEVHSSSEPDYLRLIREDTLQRQGGARMVSGHLQGRFLAMISHMLRPQVVLEIGTFTGYSALCLAEGLSENGKVVTIERDIALESVIRKNLALNPIGKRVKLIIGDAHDTLKSLDISPDLVFLDADKKGYLDYYEGLIPRMKSGAFLLTDNVLWGGKVADPEPDARTRAIMDFNEYVSRDTRIDCVLLPVRDGLTLVRKR